MCSRNPSVRRRSILRPRNISCTSHIDRARLSLLTATKPRHGTQALIAALDVHTGQVLAECRDRRTQDDLVSFMERVAAAYPDKQVHVVWDNLNTHRAQAVWQAFNARHDKRFRFYFTPLHASWVNQIELWFARYTRRVLRHASHTSTAHLRERTGRFVSEHNQAARPFKWSFRGYPLQSGTS
ncbi:IS630 family transposase [Paraburkholderia sp.]|uniref:IS630 family transposase n=1 Tax=Paraburkholderia sp. TaxID=1926495 RepID=UPI0025DCEB14|nr:IS630 family transposase [Paraburkholderia sp.]